MSGHRSWLGRRGEGYVALQAVLLALLLFGPRHLAALPDWPVWSRWPAHLAGLALLTAGLALALLSALRLGRGLTPLPHPRDDCTLVTTGPYALVRHPIYSGILLAAFGWAGYVQGGLTLVWAFCLLIFFDIKSRREEAWLVERFPDYRAYQGRVRKLLPFIY